MCSFWTTQSVPTYRSTKSEKTVFLTREEAEAALAQKGGTYEDSGGL